MTEEILTNPLVITLAISALGLIILGLIYLFGSSANVRSRLDNFVGGTSDQGVDETQASFATEGLEKMRTSVSSSFSGLASESLRMRISSAHWQISPGEYVLMQIIGTLLGGALGWALSGTLIGGLGLALFVFLLPGVILARSIDVRRQKFGTQLLDALILIRGAVQSGYSLLQALDLVKDEMPAPSSEEYGRVVREVQIGLPLSQALLNLSARMENDDLHMVVTAIIINSQVGGNLGSMLLAVSNTIRSRIYLFSEVRSITSYARYTGYLLTMMPFITALLIYISNPSYFDIVPKSPISQIILVMALIGLVLGNIWIRRIIRFKV